ncbi:hypothetical protein [Streptomyces sp. MJP52]|uniref:hypothetical protein n=1 Tax=Streptomyces sp. MJP52 TaxID=2940555 RepID=UPI00247680C8|nr:hypothetical protein [Streptomyces sp. MJP52]MDH6226245.1 hypothetical protein [Streptomyces sp. MJP52]
MTDRPYTDDDLRAEAARQHAALTEDPDFMSVGEQMDGTPIPSTVVDLESETGEPLEMSRAWSQLGDHDFDEAQRKIHDLITSAVDVSEWAVALGAEGLEPEGHTIRLGAKGPDPDDADEPFVKLHFAFHPTATAAERDRFVVELTKVITRNL